MNNLVVIFKTNITNTNNTINLNEYFDFDQVESTDDLVGLDRKNKKLVYISLSKLENQNNSFRLKLFTSHSKQIEYTRIKIRKNLLLAYEYSRLSIFDLNKVKENCSFLSNSKIYVNSFFDKNLIFDSDIDLKYLIVFEKPRNLMLFRISDGKKLAVVPFITNLKNFIAFEDYLVIQINNNELVSLMINDETKKINPEDYWKKICLLNSNDNLEAEINGIIKQINPFSINKALTNENETTNSKIVFDYDENYMKRELNSKLILT